MGCHCQWWIGMDVKWGPVIVFRCGQCNRYMKFVDVKPMRLHCAVCNVTYKLPQNGHIKLYQELKCPLDNFELVMWTTGAKGKVTMHLFVHPFFSADALKAIVSCQRCLYMCICLSILHYPVPNWRSYLPLPFKTHFFVSIFCAGF